LRRDDPAYSADLGIRATRGAPGTTQSARFRPDPAHPQRQARLVAHVRRLRRELGYAVTDRPGCVRDAPCNGADTTSPTRGVIPIAVRTTAARRRSGRQVSRKPHRCRIARISHFRSNFTVCVGS
jgi:hypothetical protein